MRVGIAGAGPGGVAPGILLALQRSPTWILPKFDRPYRARMRGTVWTTRCSNYFRAASGRVGAQWPHGARAFGGMTRRFKAVDFTFEPA